MQWDVRVPMRDGVELSADIYFPPSGAGQWPAILQRTPYDNTAALWVTRSSSKRRAISVTSRSSSESPGDQPSSAR